MRPDRQFQGLNKIFWANVRTVSQTLGYTERTTRNIKIHRVLDMAKAFKTLDLRSDHVLHPDGYATELGTLLEAYFAYRAEVLNTYVEPRLMTAERAAAEFEHLQKSLKIVLPVPFNKQSGEKKRPAYLTGLVNLIVAANSDGYPFDAAPRALTTITHNGVPLRTLARRVDGCFTSTVNPTAIWEIKEYYYTTTFGSRLADGVYETLLDGMELEEIRENEKIDIKHLLVVDAHYTWWELGRSYLCRIIDMLHMGYIDYVLFGYEVIEQLPEIVREWVEIKRNTNISEFAQLQLFVPAGESSPQGAARGAAQQNSRWNRRCAGRDDH
jgi:hypothetical protein